MPENRRNTPHGRREVAYATVDRSYFDRRALRRYARVGSLWALGVGAVISGDFFGWNFGLAAGGFGGLLVATLLMTAMYVGLCFSIAEMTAALPHAGGAYSFARSAMGPWGAYVTGLAENMEYILTPAVIVVGIGGYLGAIFETSEALEPLWWIVSYALFVGLNVVGVETSFRFTVLITCSALAILVVFWIGAVAHVDAENLAIPGGHHPLFPRGVRGAFAALPFAMWFFLAIEELPLAAEESEDPSRDMPKALLLGLLTLVISAFLTLGLSAAIPPGAAALATSNEPLFDGLTTIFGEGIGTRALALVAVTGLVASFHTIVFAYGRQIFSLSRAGYFPRILSVTHEKHKTPHVALFAGALLGLAVALLIHRLGTDHPVGAVLLNMAVFGAVLSYALQMISFIMLRIRLPHIERPYRSPLGVPGALFALAVSILTLGTLFYIDPVYQKVVLGAAIWYGAGLLYFAVHAKDQLVRAPEEDFAVSHGADARDSEGE